MPTVSMTVNGKSVSGDVEGRTLLVDFLRNNLSLTGTHVGCDTSQCGACTVLSIFCETIFHLQEPMWAAIPASAAPVPFTSMAIP